MSNSDMIVKNMISREIQNELVTNIVHDFNRMDRNIGSSLQTQLLGILGSNKNKKKIKQRTLIQEYSILK